MARPGGGTDPWSGRTVCVVARRVGIRPPAYAPFPGWSEAIAYRESDGTLYVPDSLGTGPLFTVGSERLGLFVLCRVAPPRRLLTDVNPERILVGHGRGVFDNPALALTDTLDGARRRLPQALCTSGNGQLRAALGALRS